MKKSLGKIGLLILLMQASLFANQLATYKLSANKSTAMLKEPVIVTFTVEQKNSADTMFFLLSPVKSPDYEIKLLKSLNDDTKIHHAYASFTYLLFPLKVKNIRVKFDFTLQTASDAALAQSYVDDHDGGKAIQKVSKHIELKALTIEVKAIPEDIKLFGDFTLSEKHDKNVVSKYEDINIIYTLQGEGYKNTKRSLLVKTSDVSLFKDMHDVYSKRTENGYKSKRIYTYAMSSTKDFKVPALHIKAYSFTKHKPYTLSTPEYVVQVKSINPLTLLDKKDAPNTEYFFSIKTIQKYFIYGMIFLFGFISAKLTEINFTTKSKDAKFQDIKQAQSPQALILLLMNRYKKREIKSFIEQLEKIAYKQSSQSFLEVKKEILKVFSK